MTEVRKLMGRAQQELDAAQVLLERHFDAVALSRAYYACFWAATTALGTLGYSGKTHSGVTAAFGRLLVKEQGVDPEAGRVLRRLAQRREGADYSLEDVTPDAAAEGIVDATFFVGEVERWLVEQGKLTTQ